MSEEVQEEIEVVGPGAMLKVARTSQGLTQHEVAEKLHLRHGNIADLENDHFDENVSPTFTKGYYKLYAKLLGLNEEEVLLAYEKINTKQKEPARLQSFSQKVAKQASDARLMMVTYLILLVVVALVVVWWLQQGDEIETTRAVSTPAVTQAQATQTQLTQSPATESFQTETDVVISEAEVVSQEPEPLLLDNTSAAPESLPEELADDTSANVNFDVQTSDDSSDNAIQNDNFANSESATVSNEFVADPQEDEVQEAATVEPNNSPEITTSELAEAFSTPQEDLIDPLSLQEPVDLIFEFSGDCWMTLTDATGEDIAFGVKASGYVMPVSGIPPFEVVLGAPEVVQISYNGQPIDMTRHRAGYTARFTLPYLDQ